MRKTPSSNPRIFYGWYVLAACWTMVFLVGSVAVSVFFKPMLDEFGWDRATLSSVQSVAMLAFAVASPFLGQLVDRFGPRALVLATVVTQTLSRLINGVASNLWHLYTARFLYNVNAISTNSVLMNRWFEKRRGTALGIVGTGMPLGSMVLAPVSQRLILLWGWRPTMLFWAAITFAVTLPMAFIIRNNPEDKGYGPDGRPLVAVASTPPPTRTGPGAAIARASMGGASTFSQAARTRSLRFLAATQFICGIGCGFMMTHIVIFAIDQGFSEMIAASLVSVQGASNVVGLLVTGPLSDRMSRNKVLALAHFMRALSFAVLIAAGLFSGGSLPVIYLSMLFFGFAWFTTSPLTAGLAGDLFGNLSIGTILGVTRSCHMFGTAIGAYAGGAIFELTGSYLLFFAIQAPLELMAAMCAFAVRKKGSQ